ncbi:Ribosomal protein L7/L12 C-terminal domain [Fragilaria crotonensis]|nr:Ribosomal protein L7/L12 C-terminal domain [Fragilaria crotonensis]
MMQSIPRTVGLTARQSTFQFAKRQCGYHTTVVAPRSRVNKLFERVMWLDVVEINMLNEEIQRRLGMNVRNSDTPRSEGGSSTDGAESVAVEAKTVFDLKLIGFDPNAKIKVIKEIRAIAGLGLKEAKELVEGAPKVIKKGLKEEEANQLKAKLEEIGAVIEVS